MGWKLHLSVGHAKVEGVEQRPLLKRDSHAYVGGYLDGLMDGLEGTPWVRSRPEQAQKTPSLPITPINVTARRFTPAETIRCTFIARFGRDDFDECQISNRSLSSLRMKVQNVAAMLEHRGYRISDQVSPLSGTSAGLPPRFVDWEIIEQYVDMPKHEFRRRISRHNVRTESIRRQGHPMTAPRCRRMGDEDYLQLGETHEP